MELITHEIEFNKYCKKCIYYDKKESEEPCYECLMSSEGIQSKKPIKFKEKE